VVLTQRETILLELMKNGDISRSNKRHQKEEVMRKCSRKRIKERSMKAQILMLYK